MCASMGLTVRENGNRIGAFQQQLSSRIIGILTGFGKLAQPTGEHLSTFEGLERCLAGLHICY
jgi:hypothetical protein